MSRKLLFIRLSPMLLVAFYHSAQGVILPQLLPFFGFSLGEGGLLVGGMQGVGILSMLVTGYFLDRRSAADVLVIGIAVAIAGAIGVGLAPTILPAIASLLLLATGMSSVVSSTNAVMALTGPKRGFYLGLMHATFGFLSIIAPLFAGLLVAHVHWQHYYLLWAGVALVIFYFSRISAREARSERTAETTTETDGESPPWWRVAALWSIGLGVFCMAGTQSALATWTYLFTFDVYGAPHTLATAATSIFWVGILAGRLSWMWLVFQYTERRLLVAGSLTALGALLLSWLTGSFGVALVALFLSGYGVSGSFQLGTSWAAELLPRRVGTASSIVIVSAALGGLLVPALTAVIAEAYTFASMRHLLAVGFALSALAFGGVRPARQPISTDPSVAHNRS